MNQSKINARSVSSYCEQHQHQFAEHLQAIHKASTTIERNINVNAYCVNNQCALNQQPMWIASDSLIGFSSPNTFILCSMPLKPVILRGAEGEVAESIILKNNPRTPGEEGPSQTVGEGLRRALFPSFIRPDGHLFPGRRFSFAS